MAIRNWLATLDEPPEAAVAVLRDALEVEEPLVREHAAWALGCLGAPKHPPTGSMDREVCGI